MATGSQPVPERPSAWRQGHTSREELLDREIGANRAMRSRSSSGPATSWAWRAEAPARGPASPEASDSARESSGIELRDEAARKTNQDFAVP